MSWIRSDCAMLDDEFVIGLTGDEFKAWSLFLLRVKAQGARGSVAATSLSLLARNWNVPESAVASMFQKAGDKIAEQGGRWYVKNWSKYQEDHKSKTAKGEIPPDVPDGTTLPHNTLPHNTGQDTLVSEQIEAVMLKWNEKAKECGLALVERITPKRKAGIIKRMSEPDFDLDKLLSEIQNSSFLRGGTGWRVTFDWLFLSPNNYVKVLEGQYRGSNGSGRNNSNPNSQASRAAYRPENAEREAREISESIVAMRRERAERAGTDTK